MSIAITDDRKDFDATRKRLADFDELAGVAGLFDEELAQRGARHEFGHGVPKRRWLTASTDAQTQALGNQAEREVGDVVDDRGTAREAMLELATTVADSAVEFVEGGKVGGDPLSKAAKRRDARKLIDSGAMIDAVEARVMPEREVPDV